MGGKLLRYRDLAQPFSRPLSNGEIFAKLIYAFVDEIEWLTIFKFEQVLYKFLLLGKNMSTIRDINYRIFTGAG